MFLVCVVIAMLVRRSGPVSCARSPRRGHKRVDSEETAAKSPRLSECVGGDTALFLTATPVSPRSGSAVTVCAAAGPSRIGQFLLLPSVDPAAAHSAWDMDTGEELVCKVRDLNAGPVLLPESTVAAIK